MKLWIRKISVVFVAIMTLGLYIPPATLNPNAEDGKEAFSSKADVSEDAVFTPVEEGSEVDDGNDDLISDQYISKLTDKAKEQTIAKLGPRIVNQVEDEFMTDILPNMEEVINTILTDAGEDKLPYYAITEQPSNGLGERIFNIHDNNTGKDVAKFHVRRENRPLEGYWFNFHYHLSDDNFESHHEIGEIYWDKNTPPRWMA